MIRIMMAASAAVVALTAPVMAAGDWNVITNGPDGNGCFVADRSAISGEQSVGGPYATMQQAEADMNNDTACLVWKD